MHATKLSGMRKTLSAFTLIELLVVISIIALLIGILLPALGAARKTAIAIQCKSGMRQLTIAMHAYSADNNGKFPAEIGAYPYANYSGVDKKRERYWYSEEVIGSYVPGDVKPIDGNSFGGGIFACPGDVDTALRSYSINAYSTSDYENFVPSVGGSVLLDPEQLFTADARKATQLILFAETYSRWNPADWGQTPDGHFSSALVGYQANAHMNFRSGGGGGRCGSETYYLIDWTRHTDNAVFDDDHGDSNFAFVDGHVDNYALDAVDDGTQSTYEILWTPFESENNITYNRRATR